MSKIITQPEIYAEDAMKLAFETANNILHGKLSIQKGNVIHRNLHDLNQASSNAYKAQLNMYRNPRMKYFGNRPKPKVETEEVIVKPTRRRK